MGEMGFGAGRAIQDAEHARLEQEIRELDARCLALYRELERLRAIVQEAIDKTTDRDTVLDLERAL